MLSKKVIYFHRLKEDKDVEGTFYSKGKILYIGSGGKDRPFSKANRSRLHLQLWDSLCVEIIAKNLTLENARKLEQKLINKHWTSYLLNSKKNVDVVKTYRYEMLDKLFYYTSDFELKWKVQRKNKHGSTRTKPGDTAGYFQKSGYGLVSVDSVNYSVHRVLWCLYNKKDAEAGYVVDHIDRNNRNNSPANLRLVSHGVNQRNKNCTSNTGEKYITYYEKFKYFLIQIKSTEDSKLIRRLYGLNKMLKEGFSLEAAYRIKLTEAVKIRDDLLSTIQSSPFISDSNT